MRLPKKYVYPSVIISAVMLAFGSACAAPLYFPHIATIDNWQTEIAIINLSATQSVTGTLRALSNAGQQVEDKAITLPPRGRRQVTVSNEFIDHTRIGHMIFESDSKTLQGYTKFYIDGVYRVAIPAVKQVNNSDIYISHIASSSEWWTGLSLVNTTSTTTTVTIAFSKADGSPVGTKPVTIAAKGHWAEPIRNLFGGQPQPAIASAVITDAAGIIGLELFGSFFGGSQLEGILLTDKTASTLYYPHVQGGDWWTGIVAYNPSQLPSAITITPFDAQGTPLSASTDSIPIGGQSKYVGTVTGIGLPSQTAWFKIDSSRPLSGFQLVSSNDFEQLAGYSGHGGAVAMAGVFPAFEKSGSTVITLVNTEDKEASVALTFYNDAGKALGTPQVIPIGSRAKVVGRVTPGSATYLAYSSDRNVVAALTNGSADWTMLDGLPGLAADTTTPMDAATVIDVPNTVVASVNVSATGQTITTEDATVVIPQGAVEQDTHIEIRRLEKRFNMNPYAADRPDAISAIPIGWAIDFGPAGVKFNKPVTVTIPYDPDALTEKHSRPALAYWNGIEWLVLDCTVDPLAHTVSVRLESFNGISLTAIAVGAVTAGIWVYTTIKWMAYDDPILANKAAEYVTPNDPNVKAAAAQATIDDVPITDEANLAKYLESLNGNSGAKILFGNIGKVRYRTTTGANWQKPSDYFSKNPTGKNYDGDKALGNMHGDCTDMANAAVSMFRSLGYQAKSVFGYVGDENSPHNWAEVVIGGVAYFVDERGGIQRLDKALIAQHIIRPKSDDERNFMWDETGQVPYENEWWKKGFVIKEMTIVNEGIFSGGSLGSYRGAGVEQALINFGTIKLDSTGIFSVTVPQAKTKTFLLWPDIQTTEEVTNLVLNGKWDAKVKTGNVSLTCVERILMVDWGKGNDGTKDGTYNRVTEDYTFTHNAAGEIQLVDGKVHFILETRWSRTGTKTEARVVVQDGKEKIVGIPTVTDMSRTSTSQGLYQFTYK